MTLNDVKNKLLGRFFRTEGNPGHRPDGGTSCYRPVRKKNPAEAAEQEEQQPPVTYLHSGFTGMNPPSGFDAGFTAPDYYGQPYYDPQGYAQPAPGGQPGPFSQPAYGQQDYAGRGYSRQAAHETVCSPAAGRGWTDEAPAVSGRPERGWFPPREEAAPRGNISYMPGYAPDAGAAPFSHVEHIMAMTGLKSCYEAIECMKNGETLIVELDAIANENESMRCQDMLAGAAFTLGCHVRTLQGARLVLIAPEGVKILPEESSVRPEMAPPVYAAPPAYTAPAQEPVPRQRERRSGRNAADWNAARSGQMDSYNPYTGTMPAAAGSYGNFGGYGY